MSSSTQDQLTASAAPWEERGRPIVVGVHPTWRNRSAIDWAAEAAALTGRPLDLVVVVPPPGSHPQPTDLVGSEHKWAREGAARLRTEILTRIPDLQIATTVAIGDRSGCLLDRSSHAAMTVIGRHHAHAMLGRTAHAVAADSMVPMAIVPDTWPGDGSGPVVVGLDAFDPHPSALRLAFLEAARRGAPLTIVHGVQLPTALAWEPAVVPSVYPELVSAAEAAAAAALAPYRHQFPQVAVSVEVREAHPTGLLLQYAERARLLVLGRNRPGLPWGSVVRGTLHRAHVPTLVVPHSG